MSHNWNQEPIPRIKKDSKGDNGIAMGNGRVKCSYCGSSSREFHNVKALNHHTQAKHQNELTAKRLGNVRVEDLFL